MANIDEIFGSIEGDRQEIIQALVDICKIPALDPSSGGDGELEKLEFIRSMLEDWGFDEFKRYDAQDSRTSCGFRPNLVCTYKGSDPEAKGALWMVCHTDIVPIGEKADWKHDPFEPVVAEGRIIGRGTEDNGQDLIAALYGLRALMKAGVRPKRDVKIALVAEEETGSKYGIKHLIDEELFGAEDLIVVPDGGVEDGTLLEVSERSIIWMKVTTTGKQVHASLPHKGLNAHEAAMRYGLRLVDTLRERYPREDPLFIPPRSTFEITKKEDNVPNVNTIPGEDVFFVDMRIDPTYDADEVYKLAHKIAVEVQEETGAKIKLEQVQYSKSTPPTPPGAEVVTRLAAAIKKVMPIEPKPGGIGGGTCAALFRRIGLEAVVWSKMDEVGHMPNEYALIENLIECTKVYAALYFDA